MKRILVAPLNWGLGHVTRCIPMIQELEQLGVEVVLGSDGVALHLLKAEFPHMQVLELPSYRIRYQSNNMVWNIGRQLPRIVWAVRSEQWVTERAVRALGINGILSDNRYGCFSRRANSVMLTHQLHLRVPGPALEWSANRVLRLALSKFDAVWVPDAAGEDCLSGELSHGPAVHPKTHFAGVLSRMRAYDREYEYDVAVVLSGPEPQRSILEQRLMDQAISLPQKFIFVQGRTQAKKHYYAADNVEVVSYLTSRDLNDVLLASKTLVCRSGYSSIMDLVALGKKAILIPTPGQTEQEYLIQNLDAIDLLAGIMNVGRTSGIPAGEYRTDDFKGLLRKWVEGL
ncbi:MAG: glycosyltransferase [Thermoanaerobaculia bacterium]|nr:glycosyltransferase [Thermoanaerobaculia bacterium]